MAKSPKQYSNFTEMNKNPSNNFQESSLSNPHYPTGILLPFLTGSYKNVKYQESFIHRGHTKMRFIHIPL